MESVSRRSDLAVSGKSRYGLSVTIPGSESDVGKIIPVTITQVLNNTLMAERKD